MKTIRNILLIELVLVGIAGAAGLLSGWDTVGDYAHALRFVGIITIIVGLFSLYGGFESGRSLTYIVGSMSLPKEVVKPPGPSDFVLCGIAGGLAILLSVVLG